MEGVARTDSIAAPINSMLTARVLGSASARMVVHCEAGALVCSGTATPPRIMIARSSTV
ncbi:Uncharacterised protein [Mycobacteroides abscessus subsp. abscessus]|nr:Uncharacterised protein [Mycobacteroides abscessus subsp. abscessus]